MPGPFQDDEPKTKKPCPMSILGTQLRDLANELEGGLHQLVGKPGCAKTSIIYAGSAMGAPDELFEEEPAPTERAYSNPLIRFNLSAGGSANRNATLTCALAASCNVEIGRLLASILSSCDKEWRDVLKDLISEQISGMQTSNRSFSARLEIGQSSLSLLRLLPSIAHKLREIGLNHRMDLEFGHRMLGAPEDVRTHFLRALHYSCLSLLENPNSAAWDIVKEVDAKLVLCHCQDKPDKVIDLSKKGQFLLANMVGASLVDKKGNLVSAMASMGVVNAYMDKCAAEEPAFGDAVQILLQLFKGGEVSEATISVQEGKPESKPTYAVSDESKAEISTIMDMLAWCADKLKEPNEYTASNVYSMLHNIRSAIGAFQRKLPISECSCGNTQEHECKCQNKFGELTLGEVLYSYAEGKCSAEADLRRVLGVLHKAELTAYNIHKVEELLKSLSSLRSPSPKAGLAMFFTGKVKGAAVDAEEEFTTATQARNKEDLAAIRRLLVSLLGGENSKRRTGFGENSERRTGFGEWPSPF